MDRRYSILNDIRRLPASTGVMCAGGLYLGTQLLLGLLSPGVDDGSLRLVVQSVGALFTILLLLASLISFISAKFDHRVSRKAHRHSGVFAGAYRARPNSSTE
jgi:hypothetical protein